MQRITFVFGLALTLCSMAGSAEAGRGKGNIFQNIHSGAGGTSLPVGTIRINGAQPQCAYEDEPCTIAVSATVEVNSGGAPWSICAVVDGKRTVPACLSQPYTAGQFVTGTFTGLAQFKDGQPIHKAEVRVKLTSPGTLGGWSAIYSAADD